MEGPTEENHQTMVKYYGVQVENAKSSCRACTACGLDLIPFQWKEANLL